MTLRLLDYDAIVQSLIQDRAGKLREEDRYEAIRDAVAEHSRVKPHVKRRALSGTGTAILGTPTGWVDEFSAVARLEYPVGDVPPTYLAADAWLLVSSPTASTTYQIQFQGSTPGTAERINVEWTVPHEVGLSTGTIPDAHGRAVATLAASYACLQLAGFYAQAGDPTISIDSQDPQSKSQSYTALATQYRQRYYTFFGLSSNGQNGASVAPASVFADVDRKTSWGSDFFHHSKRFR